MHLVDDCEIILVLETKDDMTQAIPVTLIAIEPTGQRDQ